MRSDHALELISLIAYLASGAAWSASAHATDMIHIAALDCEFQLPTSYTVKIGDEPGAYLYSTASTDYTSFTFAPLAIALSEGFPAPIATAQRGPLAIEHYAVAMSGRSAPTNLYMTLIRGQSQQLMVSGLRPEQIEKYVVQCLETMDPAVVAAAKRRAQGCASELPLQTIRQEVLGSARSQPVFGGAKLIGWRIYDMDAAGPLARAGILQGTLLTHICEVPVDELMASPDRVCCASDTSREISTTFRQDRGPPKTVLIRRGT